MDGPVTPDERAVDTWYWLAVMRVYRPWLRQTGPVPDGERSRASGRVEHARLVLAFSDVPPPTVMVTFNLRETRK